MRSLPVLDSYLDCRNKSPDDNYFVKIRVTYRRKTRYYKTGLKWTELIYDEAIKIRPKPSFRIYKTELEVHINRAKDILSSISSFSFEEFSKKYYQFNSNTKDVLQVYDELINYFIENEKHRTAETYKYSKKLVIDYFKPTKSFIPFNAIRTDNLNNLKSHYETEGLSPTTISMYLRVLKRVYNYAIEKKYITHNETPFVKDFIIPNVLNKKKALSPEILRNIINYKAKPNSQLCKAIDFWLLSFYCCGMNINDILRLRNNNVSTDNIIFIRRKTLKTNSRTIEPILVPIDDNIRTIIEKYRSVDHSPNNYLFPYLIGDYNSRKIVARIRNFIGMINKQLDKHKLEFGLSDDMKISTNSARHSFATLAINEGVSIQFVSQSLGHSSIATTETYIKSLGTDILKELREKVFEKLFK
jgi:integrase